MYKHRQPLAGAGGGPDPLPGEPRPSTGAPLPWPRRASRRYRAGQEPGPWHPGFLAGAKAKVAAPRGAAGRRWGLPGAPEGSGHCWPRAGYPGEMRRLRGRRYAYS